MILYHGITTYHLLKFVVHKLNYHPNEEAIILLPKFLLRKPSGLLKLKDTSIFKNVYFFSWERECNIPNITKDRVYKKIEEELKNAFQGLTINDFSEVNVARAAYLFGSWLVDNKVVFNWFEEADGRFTEPEPIMKDDERIFPLRYQLAKERGLYNADNDLVLHKYIKLDAQTFSVDASGIIDFNIMAELKRLDEHDQRRILDFFDIPIDLEIESNSGLMLTQHFANMRILSYENHALCYQLTADYFLNNMPTYYKWHPSDIMPYTDFMESVNMLPGDFPAELLTLIIKQPFKIGASINSTGILNLSSICEKILTFNQEYISTFHDIHRYYFILQLAKMFSNYTLSTLGMNTLQFKNLREFGDINITNKCEALDGTIDITFKSKEPHIYVVANSADQSYENIDFYEVLQEKDILIFLNIGNQAYYGTLFSNMPLLTKEIYLQALDSNVYGNEISYEQIFIFTKDMSAREQIKNMKYVKNLINTGIKTSVFAASDKDYQIMALQGMLKATENQLKKVVEENNFLKEHKDNYIL